MTTDNTTKPLQRNRLDRVTTAAAVPESLVGTFFLSDARRGWQGCVVAEPATGIYLVELFSWLLGDSSEQRLVRLDDMVESEWHFYDDAYWMNNAYEHEISQHWERERTEES